MPRAKGTSYLYGTNTNRDIRQYVKIKKSTLLAYRKAMDTEDELVSQAIEIIIKNFQAKEYSRSKLNTLYKKLVQFYGKTAAQAAVEFYTTLKEESGVMNDYIAEYYDGLLYMDGTTQAQKLYADVEKAIKKYDPTATLASYAQTRIRNIASNTLYRNAQADPSCTYWQRIAHVGCCGWCAVLASRGAEYLSEASAEAANLHEHCKCTAVPVFKVNTEFEGYDETPFKQQYQQAAYQVGSGSLKALATQIDANNNRIHLSAEAIAERNAKRAARAAKKQA